MSRDQLVSVGAFALYRSENGHRIAEFEKATNSGDLIARDFELFRGRYVRMFEDIVTCLEEEGLTVKQIA